MVEARSEGELAELVRSAYEPLLVLAGGSNVVVADGGFPGTVVRVLTRGIERDGERLEVQAGEPWDELVAMTVADGLQGFECLSGIPGLAGATPRVAMRTTVPGKPSSATTTFEPPASTSSGAPARSAVVTASITASSLGAST